MSPWSLLAFTAAILIAASIPGPTIVTLVARVLTGGRKGAGAFIAGLVLGDLAWMSCSVFGTMTLAIQAHAVMVVLKYLGAAYLAWLAVKLWTAPPTEPTADEAAPQVRSTGFKAVTGGLMVALSNPKTMIFYMALMPNLIDVGHVDPAGFAALSAIVFAVLTLVLSTYVIAAGRARHFFRSTRAMRRVNRTGSLVMAGTAVLVATRQ